MQEATQKKRNGLCYYNILRQECNLDVQILNCSRASCDMCIRYMRYMCITVLQEKLKMTSMSLSKLGVSENGVPKNLYGLLWFVYLIRFPNILGHVRRVS